MGMTVWNKVKNNRGPLFELQSKGRIENARSGQTSGQKDSVTTGIISPNGQTAKFVISNLLRFLIEVHFLNYH